MIDGAVMMTLSKVANSLGLLRVGEQHRLGQVVGHASGVEILDLRVHAVALADAGYAWNSKSIKKLRHVASELRLCKLQRAILNIP